MSFKSKKQAAWLFKNEPKIAKRWAAETMEMSELPDKVKKRKILKGR